MELTRKFLTTCHVRDDVNYLDNEHICGVSISPQYLWENHLCGIGRSALSYNKHLIYLLRLMLSGCLYMFISSRNKYKIYLRRNLLEPAEMFGACTSKLVPLVNTCFLGNVSLNANSYFNWNIRSGTSSKKNLKRKCSIKNANEELRHLQF